jgi:hypothetical protein
VLLSLAALGVSIVALVFAMRDRGVSGRGLAAYDMSTPQTAVKSLVQMEAYGDVLAQMQMEQAMSACNRQAKEKESESLSFGKTYTHEGKTAVLYSFLRDGKPRYEVQWLGQDPGGCYHALTGMPEWCFEDPAGTEGEIAKAIREWEAKNTTPMTTP